MEIGKQTSFACITYGTMMNSQSSSHGETYMQTDWQLYGHEESETDISRLIDNKQSMICVRYENLQ